MLLDRATFILRYLEQVRNDVTATQRDPRGAVTLGMSPGLALTLALPLFEEISSRFPGVQLQIIEDYTEALHDRLLQGTVDLAILNGPHLEKPNLVTTALMEEQICLIDLATNPHLPKQSIDVRALSKIPLVLAGVAKAGVREVVETAAARAGVKLEPKIEVQSLEVAKRIISQGKLCTAHFAAPTKAQATPSRIRCLACSRTRSGTSASVVPASQVASRPVGPAGSVAASEERGAALVPVISMARLHSVSWSASASLPLARVG